MKNKTNLSFKHLTFAFALIGTTALVQAADLSGDWTWVTPGRNGNPDHTNTLNLKVDGSTLTGKVSAIGRGGKTIDTPITEGKVDGDKVSFNVVHENKGVSNTNSFTGTVAADQITGKIGFVHDGKEQSRDWKAKHSTDTK
jgi:hypothetical protein